MPKTFQFLKSLSFHPDKNWRSLITLTYVTIGLYANFYLLQVFCTPVAWSSVYSLASLAVIILIPYIEIPLLKGVFYFLLGCASLTCIYSILFIADPWDYFRGYILTTIGILFFGIGLLSFIPVYLLWHVVNYVKQEKAIYKTIFIIGMAIPLLVLASYLKEFKKDYESLEHAYKTNTVSQLQPTVITEQLLGIGYKYHTKIEYIYDGWRPPVHDPFLNIGLWIYGESYFPFKKLISPFTQLDRPKYYKILFPDKSLKVDCVCSHTDDGESYQDDNFAN